jgi:hypothetical protein
LSLKLGIGPRKLNGGIQEGMKRRLEKEKKVAGSEEGGQENCVEGGMEASHKK